MLSNNTQTRYLLGASVEWIPLPLNIFYQAMKFLGLGSRKSDFVYFKSAAAFLGLKYVLFMIAGLATQYLLTHKLIKADYGLLIWVANIVAILLPFSLPGISNSIPGAVSNGFDGNFKQGTRKKIWFSFLGGIVLFAVSAFYWIVYEEKQKALIILIAGIMAPGLWLDTHLCYWNGKKAFKTLCCWAIPVRICQLIILYVTLQITQNPIWIFSVQSFVQVFANIVAVARIFNDKDTNDQISLEYTSFGNVSNILYIFGGITSQFDKLIIGNLLGLEKLAIFSVGELIFTYLFQTPKKILDQIYVPQFARMEKSETAIWIQKSQKMLTLFVLVVLTIVAIALPYGYEIFFSSNYSGSIYYAKLFLVNMAVSIPILLVGAMMRAHGLKKESIVSQFIISFTPLVLIFPFIHFWGMQGVVFSRIVQNIILSCYYMIILKKYSLCVSR